MGLMCFFGPLEFVSHQVIRRCQDSKREGLTLVQRKTKGQQLKGKIVSALSHTFWQFSTYFHTFSEFFRIFPPRLFLELRGFTAVLVQN